MFFEKRKACYWKTKPCYLKNIQCFLFNVFLQSMFRTLNVNVLVKKRQSDWWLTWNCGICDYSVTLSELQSSRNTIITIYVFLSRACDICSDVDIMCAQYFIFKFRFRLCKMRLRTLTQKAYIIYVYYIPYICVMQKDHIHYYMHNICYIVYIWYKNPNILYYLI